MIITDMVQNMTTESWDLDHIRHMAGDTLFVLHCQAYDVGQFFAFMSCSIANFPLSLLFLVLMSSIYIDKQHSCLTPYH